MKSLVQKRIGIELILINLVTPQRGLELIVFCNITLTIYYSSALLAFKIFEELSRVHVVCPQHSPIYDRLLFNVILAKVSYRVAQDLFQWWYVIQLNVKFILHGKGFVLFLKLHKLISRFVRLWELIDYKLCLYDLKYQSEKLIELEWVVMKMGGNWGELVDESKEVELDFIIQIVIFAYYYFCELVYVCLFHVI